MMMKAPNHWGEFKAAEGELRKRALSKKYEHIHKDRREAMKKMLADLNKATKFYVPNLSTAVENNDIFYPHEPVNLPYPSIAVLCEIPAEVMKASAELTLAHVSPKIMEEEKNLRVQMHELTEAVKENKSSWSLVLASQPEVNGVIYVRRLDYMPYKGGTWIPKTYEVDYSPNEDGTYAVKLSSDAINVLTAGMEVASMHRPPEGFDVADFYRTSVVNRMAAVVGEYRYAIADITALCTLLSLRRKRMITAQMAKPTDPLPKETALQKQTGGTHYKNMAIQPAEYAEKNGLSLLEGNVVKYITRWKLKGQPLADLEKAKHCIDLLIEIHNVK
jgi:hypothetical protein